MVVEIGEKSDGNSPRDLVIYRVHLGPACGFQRKGRMGRTRDESVPTVIVRAPKDVPGELQYRCEEAIVTPSLKEENCEQTGAEFLVGTVSQMSELGQSVPANAG